MAELATDRQPFCSMLTLNKLWAAFGAVARRVLPRDAVRDILHCVLLLVVVTLLRPHFMNPLPNEFYSARDVVAEVLRSDVDLIVEGARRNRPVVPKLLFLAIPTIAFILSRRSLRWSDWEHGRSLRMFVVALLVIIGWSASTFPYNIYLARLHAIDRVLVVALVALSWKTPLAVPFATRWALVMLREADVPIVIDDFDFRAITDVLIVFSCFVWLSFRRSFKAHHFLVAALGSWASYYFAAGVAKWNYGPPHSWLLENHLSNLGASAYIRGWLAFLEEDFVMSAVALARRMDVLMAGFAFVVELGALVGFFIHERLTRVFFWLCFIFHFGIFVVSGIFFWKWMATNVIFFIWLKRCRCHNRPRAVARSDQRLVVQAAPR